MRKYHISIGDKYNKLTCLSFSHVGPHNRSYFNFRCDCGNEKVLLGALVKSGNTMSCGCYGKARRKEKRISDSHSDVTAILLGYIRHAKKRGHEWGLSREHVLSLIFKECHYCGRTGQNIKKTKQSIGGGLKYNGIDRKDNKIGYLESNCVPCCGFCNKAKGIMDYDEFINWILLVHKKIFTK